MILPLLLLFIIFTNMVLITALFLKSKNGVLRKALIVFFISVGWSAACRFIDMIGLAEINIVISLVPFAITSTFLTYYLYTQPYNVSK